MKDLFDSFQRASFYVSTYILFKSLVEFSETPPEVAALLESIGVDIPKLSRENAQYLRQLAARNVRQDLPATARAHLPFHVKAFMAQAGYLVHEPADSILAMTAFAARLAMDAYLTGLKDEEKARKTEQQLIRFIHTHLLPMLENSKPADESLRKTMNQLTHVIRKDRAILFKELSTSRIKRKQVG